MKYLSLFVLLLLVACGNKQVKPDPIVVVDEKQTVHVSSYLLQPCPEMQKLEHVVHPDAKELAAIQGWKAQSDECRNKHLALVAAVKKAFNIKESQSSK